MNAPMMRETVLRFPGSPDVTVTHDNERVYLVIINGVQLNRVPVPIQMFAMMDITIPGAGWAASHVNDGWLVVVDGKPAYAQRGPMTVEGLRDALIGAAGGAA